MSKHTKNPKDSNQVKRKKQRAETKADKTAENTKRKAKATKHEPTSHEREHEFH
jgi:hypothetical protein